MDPAYLPQSIEIPPMLFSATRASGWTWHDQTVDPGQVLELALGRLDHRMITSRTVQPVPAGTVLVQCPHCANRFISENCLGVHVARRHSGGR